VITGPTAVGKTGLGVQLAKKLQTEIISADSRQFYQELKIGTATPRPEELAEVKHHFVGHLTLSDSYNVSIFQEQALGVISKIFDKSNYCILLGGSGLYIDAIWRGFDEMPPADENIRNQIDKVYQKEGLPGLRLWLKQIDPDFYLQLDPANPNRIKRAIEVTLSTGIPYSRLRTNTFAKRPFSMKFVVLDRPKEELFKRINHRVDQMVDEGLIEEALGFFKFRQFNALKTVGYRELFDWLSGCYSLEMALEKIKTHTRRYAKRQKTWFRRYPDALWVHPENIQQILNFIK